MLAYDYFRSCAKDGRAVLVYRQMPDEFGDAEPRLWLCMIENVLVACDDVGPDPEKDNGADRGYLKAIPANAKIESIRRDWTEHRQHFRADRKQKQKRASAKYITYQALPS